MRAIAWLLALFAAAVAVALLAGSNEGTVTLFWPPWRIDVSLNLALVLLVGGFVMMHLALRGVAALFSMPAQARRWRVQQRERTMHAALLEGFTHLMAGRFLRARKAAEAALLQQEALAASGHRLQHTPRLRALSHLVSAESAHALQDKAMRDTHLQRALADTSAREEQDTREGIQLRATRWALADRDPQAALRWLDDMPHGAARRTLALRARLKAARQAGQTLPALETARLLAKHRAFSPDAAHLILKGLALELVHDAHDPAQLQRAWSLLEPAERRMPDVATSAAHRLVDLQGEVALSRQWLQAVWDDLLRPGQPAPPALPLVKLIRALEAGFAAEQGPSDLAWLERIEAGAQQHPRCAELQYLAGVACLRHQLWGKAQRLLSQAVGQLHDLSLQRTAWRALATLAEQREDGPAAAEAYRRAALL